jgi:hypothetical protein
MVKKKTGKTGEPMTRQEAAVWLGRALSSNEVAIRLLLQLTDVISLQQQAIQALYEQSVSFGESDATREAFQQLECGLSDDLQAKLNELRKQLQPILKMVDEACRNLENML